MRLSRITWKSVKIKWLSFRYKTRLNDIAVCFEKCKSSKIIFMCEYRFWLRAQLKRTSTKSNATYAIRLPMVRCESSTWIKPEGIHCIVPQSFSFERIEVILSNLAVLHIIERTIPRYSMIDERGYEAYDKDIKNSVSQQIPIFFSLAGTFLRRIWRHGTWKAILISLKFHINSLISMRRPQLLIKAFPWVQLSLIYTVIWLVMTIRRPLSLIISIQDCCHVQGFTWIPKHS